MKERLEQLLRQVDDRTPAPRALAHVSQEATSIARRRRKTGRIIATCALLVLAGGVGWQFWQRQGTTTPDRDLVKLAATQPATAPTTVPHRASDSTSVAADDATVRTRAEIARLRSEADLHLDAAEKLLAIEAARTQSSRRRAAREVARPHPDEVAFALVYQADRIRATPGQTTAAIELYRRVAADFPKSPSATVARQRLALLDNGKDG